MKVEELLKRYGAGERDFTGIDLSEANLSGINLSGANFSEASLSVTNLSGANLSRANLSRARLNVARLSGANLNQARLDGAILNVANLIRADLRGASLVQAAAIRAEMIRADLSEADLSGANLSGADLREARLRQAHLRGASLSEANLRGTCLVEANLEQANLNGTDIARADLSGVNLRDAELRQANLSRANLSGANLFGTNLRWAEMSGTNLRWADLSEAKLSGANLIGADLSDAHLLNASLIHADLTQARLIRADWVGADLTEATLTGAKLYAVSRFGLKTEGMTCDWVDLSPNGDRSQIRQLTSEESSKLFNKTSPTVQIAVDTPFTSAAHLTLATVYHEIAQQYLAMKYPPNLQIGRRRTEISFTLESDSQLFAMAYAAIFPFKDAVSTHKNIIALIEILRKNHNSDNSSSPGVSGSLQRAVSILMQSIQQVRSLQLSGASDSITENDKFFQAPTQTILTNSSSQTLNLYYHPMFGKHLVKTATNRSASVQDSSRGSAPVTLPASGTAINFVKNFHL